MEALARVGPIPRLLQKLHAQDICALNDPKGNFTLEYIRIYFDNGHDQLIALSIIKDICTCRGKRHKIRTQVHMTNWDKCRVVMEDFVAWDVKQTRCLYEPKNDEADVSAEPKPEVDNKSS
jgi:hypothetical protein